jgi:hypothetical protein
VSNLAQVKQQIKFHLSQLADENGHHKFEHICRHLCRQRICSNIVPSTGPVSSGGDQGIDFESFRTHLKKEFGTSSFLGLISEGFAVFACSIQKGKGLIKKIKTDVGTICKLNDRPTEIHFFSTQPIPVSKKHELKNWARKEYKLNLEIFDIEAISELMAHFELFWIATQFLDMPPEVFPKAEENNLEHYYTTLEFFQKLDQPVFNYAEFFELKSIVREATFNEKVKKDLPFLLEKLGSFIERADPELKEQATYEKIVCTLRGMGSLEGSEDIVKEYFTNISTIKSIAQMERLQIILQYVVGAIKRGICELPFETALEWKATLEKLIENDIKRNKMKSRKVALLRIRGTLALLDGQTPEDALSRALTWWNKLVPQLSKVPAFPIESFSDEITQCFELLGGTSELERLAEKVDTVLAKRAGNAIAAEKARDRAFAYYENGSLVKGISHLHNAAVKFHQKETMRGSVLSLMMLSDWYQRLKLTYAAKYFAMIAFRLVFNDEERSNTKYLPKIVELLCDAEYSGGNWLSFLETSKLFWLVFGHFDKDPKNNFFTDKTAHRVSSHITLLGFVTTYLKPEFLDDIKEKISEFESDNFFSDTIHGAKEIWGEIDQSEIVERVRQDLADIPFADCGKERNIQWSQFGLNFRVSFENQKDIAFAAEAFVATLQILFLDLAEEFDLRLLPGNAEISFKLAEEQQTVILKQLPSNEIYKWELLWPSEWDQKRAPNRLAAAFQLISEASVLPTKTLLSFLEDRMKKGLNTKVFGAGTYEGQISQIGYLDEYDSTLRLSLEPLVPLETFSPLGASEISWQNGIAPEYPSSEIEEMLKRRYENTRKMSKFTLQKLIKLGEFRDTVCRLRSEGWLDWQILGGISSIILNYRTAKIMERGPHSPERFKKVFTDMFSKEEKESDMEVPLSQFNYDDFLFNLKFSLGSTFKGLGYDLKRDTPNFQGMIEFARYRLKYFDDDIPHDDFLTSTGNIENHN